MDSETARVMHAAGCRKIGFGVETLFEDTLRLAKPSVDPGINKVREGLECASRVGILVRAFLILGFPTDTTERMTEICSVLPSWPVDDIRLGFLCPYPGTALFHESQAAGRIMVTDFSRYTSEEPTLLTDSLSSADLLQWRERIFHNFYSSEEYRERVRQRTQEFPELKDSFAYHLDFVKDQLRNVTTVSARLQQPVSRRSV
jgi:radical SAM superfamily enzyme YgiQ (UPF0313 family)